MLYMPDRGANTSRRTYLGMGRSRRESEAMRDAVENRRESFGRGVVVKQKQWTGRGLGLGQEGAEERCLGGWHHAGCGLAWNLSRQ